MIDLASLIPYVPYTAVGIGLVMELLQRNGNSKVRNTWNHIMDGSGVKNKSEDTFTMLKVEKKDFGYGCIIGIPFGKSYDKLKELLPVIKTNYGCEAELESKENYAILNLYYENFENKNFEVVKTKPYELFFGYDRSGAAIKIDMLKFPHVLISGAPNWGKTYAIIIALTNLVMQHDNIDIHIIQISDKPDFVDFIGIKQLKSYVEFDYYEALKVFQGLLREKQSRNILLKKSGCKTIKEYNQMFKNKPMHFHYVVTDEFSNYMPGEKRTDRFYDVKAQCMDALKRIAKEGRSCGIYLITAMQRPDVESMDGDMKNCFNCRIAFHANNIFSSRTMIDCDDAVDLKERECIILTGERYKVKTPNISSNIINDCLKEKKTKPENDEVKTNFVWTDLSNNSIPLLLNKATNKENMQQPRRRRRGDIDVNSER